MWRAAVLAAIKRQRPHDEAAWELAHQHFGCARETAASLQLRAQVRPTPLQLQRTHAGFAGRSPQPDGNIKEADSVPQIGVFQAVYLA